ncbi:unnamed protein product [Microthlaspi erraticum]|uniref:Uncharacterized protein n=1 Tax=Microthlaspi erraticum TaxID=1685480 RepID=A0A6D2LD41_9BRAS|nr:unnamed protein product [Microthlaspi erraticum]
MGFPYPQQFQLTNAKEEDFADCENHSILKSRWDCRLFWVSLDVPFEGGLPLRFLVCLRVSALSGSLISL